MKIKNVKKGFSLVELLAAMAVLAMLAVLLAQVFTGTTTVYTSSFSKSNQNAVGRAALNFISKELYTALCDDLVPIYVEGTEAIGFLSLGENLGGDTAGGTRGRSAAVVVYAVEESSGSGSRGDANTYTRPQLVRYYSNKISDVNAVYAGGSPLAISNGDSKGVLADDIATFEVTAYDFEGVEISPSASGMTSVAYFEIYLEVLGKDIAPYVNNAHKDASGKSITSEEYVAFNCNRYFTRVQVPNSVGYRIDQLGSN